MQVFNSEQFGQLRTITENDKTIYCGIDICTGLGYAKPRNAIAAHCRGALKRGVPHPQNPEKQIEMTFITEGDVYRLIAHSTLPAAEKFESWVFDDVLPSIRKHGMYATPVTIDNILNDPDFGIRLLTELKDERNKRAALEEKIENDAPFTEFGMAISTTKGSITVKQFAANLCQLGYKTGEKRMFEEFRQDGFLLTSGNYRNEPAQRYMEMGLFEVRTSSYDTPMGTKIGRQVLITAKGLQYFIDYYMRKHGLMTLLTVHRQQAIETRRPR